MGGTWILQQEGNHWNLEKKINIFSCGYYVKFWNSTTNQCSRRSKEDVYLYHIIRSTIKKLEPSAKNPLTFCVISKIKWLISEYQTWHLVGMKATQNSKGWMRGPFSKGSKSENKRIQRNVGRIELKRNATDSQLLIF